MPVRRAEGDRVFAGRPAHRREGSADMGIEHRELELEIIDAGVRHPHALLRVKLRDVRAKHEIVVVGVELAGLGLVHAVVLDLVDAQNERLLERPCRDVKCELGVAGLDAVGVNLLRKLVTE